MRRRFARVMGRPMRGVLRRSISPLLMRSNQLLAAGDYEQAAQGLEELARGAEDRGGRRAGQLYLEAGRAKLLAGQRTAGIALLERGLRLLAASGATLRLARAGRRIVGELMGRGLQEEAEQVRNSLTALGAANAEVPSEAGAVTSQAPLPTHCPGCGAPVHPDEVEWLDHATAECEYCGTPMRAA